MAQAWPGQQIIPPPSGGNGRARPSGPNVRVLVPPSPSPPTAARPDQARGEAAQATNQEYDARTRPDRDRRERERNDRNDRFTQSQQILTRFRADPQVREFEQARTAHRALERLVSSPSALSDVAIIFSFMKSLDPTSVVRESEQATAQNAAGIPDVIRNYYNRALSGQRLSPTQRREMLGASSAMISGRGESYNEIAHRTRWELQRLGVPWENIREDINYSLADGARGPDFVAQDRRRLGLPPEPERMTVTDASTTPDANFMAPERQLGGGMTVGEPVPSAEDIRLRDGLLVVLNQGATREQAQQWLNDNFPGASLSDGQWQAIEAARRNHQDINLVPGATATRSREEALGNFMRETFDPGNQVGTGLVGLSQGVTAGFGDEIASALVSAGETVSGNGSFSENYQRNQQQFSEGQQALREANPGTYALSELAGAVVLPTGVANAARHAATQALRSGLPRAEALVIAREAASRRMALEGAGYGAGYGAGTAEGSPLDRLDDAAFGAAIGWAGGRALPHLDPGRAGGRPTNLPPLVHPQTERLNEPLEYASPQARADAMRAYGIDPTLGAVGDRGVGIVESGLDNFPLSAGVMNDSRRVLSTQVEDAVETQAANYGSARGLNEGGAAIQNSARSWIERAQGARDDLNDGGTVGRAYDAVPITPTQTAVHTNTLGALRELNQRFASNPELAEALRSGELQRYQQALEHGSINWQDLKDFRSIVGNRIGERRFDENMGGADLRRLYAALSEDMRATAASISPQALRRFERANDLNRRVEERIQRDLSQVLGPDNLMNPERAARRVQEIIRSGSAGSDLRLLSNIRASTIKDGGWNEFSGSLIRLMGQPANSVGRGFDPNVFVRSYADMSKPARNLLFGNSNNQLRQSLDGFVAVNQRLARRNALRNTSNTGPTIAGIGTLYGLGNNPIALAKVGATAYGLSKAWTNPGFVRLVTRIASLGETASNATSRVSGAVAGSIGSSLTNKQAADLRRHFARVARSAPSIAAEVAELERYVLGDSGGE